MVIPQWQRLKRFNDCCIVVTCIYDTIVVVVVVVYPSLRADQRLLTMHIKMFYFKLFSGYFFFENVYVPNSKFER